MQHLSEVIVLLLSSILVLASCIAPVTPTPSGPISVSAHFAGPVRLGVPVPVVVAVTTEQTLSGVNIFVSTSSPDAVIEGEYSYEVNTLAGEPISCIFNVRFNKEGWFIVVGQAIAPGVGVNAASVSLQITQSGATMNPEPDPRTPLPIEKVSPGAQTPQPTPTPRPTPGTPTPWSGATSPFCSPLSIPSPVGTRADG